MFARGLTLKFAASVPVEERAKLLTGLARLDPGAIVAEDLDADRVRLTALNATAWESLQSHVLLAQRDGLVRIADRGRRRDH